MESHIEMRLTWTHPDGWRYVFKEHDEYNVEVVYEEERENGWHATE